jgi:hypothetical protein
LIVEPTIFLMPDLFGFLIWEMKENWSLYRANRPATLQPVVVGAHGETVVRLLRPGFHSGTVPWLYSRLRAAERKAVRTGNWQTARGYRQALHEVEQEVKHFVQRDFAALVCQSLSWKGHHFEVGGVLLATNRILVELVHSEYTGTPVWLEFEQHGAWLVACVRDRGWLVHLDLEQARAMNTSLACLYKLAGVDLVREQVTANLPPAIASFDITAKGLLLWLDRRHGQVAQYDLHARQPQLEPLPSGDTPSPGPVLDAERLLFARFPLSWNQVVQSWQKDQDGQGHPPLFNGERELLLVSGGPPVQQPVVEQLSTDSRVANGETEGVPETSRSPAT